MKIIIVKEKEYEDGKPEINYCVKLKNTKWYETLQDFILLSLSSDGYPIACFDTLEEAKKCRELYAQGKWNNIEYSRIVEE